MQSTFLFRVLKCRMTNGTGYIIKRRCSALMKAVILPEYGAPDVLKIQEVPQPSAGNSEVLVRVHAAGVNPVDVYMREGAFMSLPPLPMILGKEVSGVIEQIGSLVNSFKVGDKVCCCLPRDGGYAQYVTCPENRLLPLSDDLTFAQGASLYVAYFVAYRALITKSCIKKGEKLLVHGGSGGVGVASIQIAKAKGLTVAATAGTDEGLLTAKAAGADNVFNHKEKGYLLKLYASTGATGFDVILENCADENLGKDFNLLAPGGRIVVVGTRGPIKPSPTEPKMVKVNPRSLIYTEGTIKGANLVAISEDEFIETREAVLRGVAEGWLRPIVNREFRLSQASQAHKVFVSERTGAAGKVVLSLTL